jgi:hypothetical protein
MEGAVEESTDVLTDNKTLHLDQHHVALFILVL